jgi:hypothetical protein
MLENATVSLWKPWGTMPFCKEVIFHKSMDLLISSILNNNDNNTYSIIIIIVLY